MKSMFHKITALALAVCMLCSFGVLSASAAGAYEDGSYTAAVRFLHESKDDPSMCNPMFVHQADITVKGDSATMVVYVANPVPGFPDQGADGTVKNVKMTLGGVQYEAVSDLETKPVREFDETNSLFGITAKNSYPTQVLTFTIPVAQLDALLAAPATVVAFVNVVMNSTQTFRMQVTNLVKAGSTPAPQPDETLSRTMQITAMIEAPAPKYSVVIPQNIAMGTLSQEEDNTVAYTVNVEAENLGSGKVTISAPAAGSLTSGDNALAYTNSFGSQTTSVTGDLKGAFTVKAEDVAKAAAGNYTGTVSFAIAYYAGK